MNTQDNKARIEELMLTINQQNEQIQCLYATIKDLEDKLKAL